MVTKIRDTIAEVEHEGAGSESFEHAFWLEQYFVSFLHRLEIKSSR